MGYRKHKHLGPFSAEKPKQSQIPSSIKPGAGHADCRFACFIYCWEFSARSLLFRFIQLRFLKSPSKIKWHTYGMSSGMRRLSETGYFCLCLTA